jgi:thioredoxin 1
VTRGGTDVSVAAAARLLQTVPVDNSGDTPMLTRRQTFLALAAAGALAAAAAPAFAAPQTYDQKAFVAAQSAGKPILLHITAPWCPTCKAQKPILSKLEALPRFKDMVVMDIDFDSQKALLRTLRVNQQSTLIVYQGKHEVGRSTGDTDSMSLEALLAKAI